MTNTWQLARGKYNDIHVILIIYILVQSIVKCFLMYVDCWFSKKKERGVENNKKVEFNTTPPHVI